jgi:hypothetical protein
LDCTKAHNDQGVAEKPRQPIMCSGKTRAESQMQYPNISNKTQKSIKNAAILFSDKHRASKLSQLISIMGCAVMDGISITDNSQSFDTLPKIDLLLIDLRSETDHPVGALDSIARYLNHSGAQALVWTDMEWIEAAYAALPIAQCHYLVGASDTEAMLILSEINRRGMQMEQLHDSSKNTEFGALHRISDELADFARTLAKIAEQDADSDTGGLAEKPISFRPAPTGLLQSFDKQLRSTEPQKTSHYIRDVIKLRRLRERFFEAELFADPAWDILLDLYAARLESTSVSVSSLCIAASVPATTALRWISGMTESKMLIRTSDPRDARRVFIDLSEQAYQQLTDYFVEVRKRKIEII